MYIDPNAGGVYWTIQRQNKARYNLMIFLVKLKVIRGFWQAHDYDGIKVDLFPKRFGRE